jgi:hypothetical protein
MSDDWLTAAREPKKLPAVVAGYEIAGLLVHLMRKKTSGRLTFKVGEVERTIQMMQGVISSVASRDPKEHLVARFRYRRRFDKKQHAAVQALMETEKLRFGAALVKLKLVDSETFSGMLSEHHAFLLGRCLRAQAVHVTLDVAAKGPADRAPLKFLDAVERAVRAMPIWRRWALASRLRTLMMSVAQEDVPLINRLDPSAFERRIIDAALAGGARTPSLVAQAGGRKAAAGFSALALCGVLRPSEASLGVRRSPVPAFLAVFALGLAAGAFGMHRLLDTRPEPAVVAPALAATPEQERTPTSVAKGAPEPAVPEACRASLAAAEQALKESKTQKALDELGKTKKCAPESAPVWRAIGVAWTQKGKPKKAAEAFSKYIELAPGAPDEPVIRHLLGADLP